MSEIELVQPLTRRAVITDEMLENDEFQRWFAERDNGNGLMQVNMRLTVQVAYMLWRLKGLVPFEQTNTGLATAAIEGAYQKIVEGE